MGMKVLQFLRHNILLISTLLAVVLGIVAGMVCRPLKPSSDTIHLVQFPGELFLRMLKMLMLPLIIASIITGLGNMKGSSAGRIGVLSMVYYASTSVVATLVGLTVVLTIKPGAYSDSSTAYISHNNAMTSTTDIFLDLLRNIVPDNIVAATSQHSSTVTRTEDGGSFSYDFLNDTENSTEVNMTNQLSSTRKTQLVDGANILGVLMYCIVFGVTLSQLGRSGTVVTEFFTVINTVTLKMIRLVMWYSPFGILFLIMGQIMSTTDMTETGQTLAIYIATELAGLAIHSLVVLPGLYFILTRKNPFAIYLKIVQALLTAFATASSAATLPVTMQCVEERMKIDTRISRFVLPAGATVNMDGGAVYAAIAPVFIAQYNGVSLSFGDVIIVSLTAILSSVGTAGVPGAGLAVLLLVLKSVGLPDRGVSFLITVEWLLDRTRTMVNVASDCLVVGVVSRYTNLPPRDQSETQSEPLREEQVMLESELV
ncbi:excitatory amino acid transporter-like [Haliotis rufescens]|uniref:excitatory amino acid transporter-like n=1 Tax=Haliotis rufescens TaxID=6454 RepID=UPI00201F9F78|nr:excitatory amino acid transporter-like [Haliotis rufescens]